MELVVSREEAQLHLALLHRADAADDVGEHLVRGVGLELVVLPPAGHVVGVVGQEDQVAAVPHIQALDDLLIKGLPGLAVLEAGGAQGGEQLVLGAVRHLLGGEHDVHLVLAQGAGQGLFQQAQVLLRLLLGHGAQGLGQIGNDLLAGVDVAAVDVGDGAFIRAEAAAQLAQFFLIHK